MENTPSRSVLVAPLDWGLGHATRCIPIIQAFRQRGYKVLIGASGSPKALLEQEFPDAIFEDLPEYNPAYPKGKHFIWSIVGQLPKILNAVRRERLATRTLVDKHKLSLIISDNRFGVRHPSVRSVFVSHQISMRLPEEIRFMETVLNGWNRMQIRKFDECWVPDFGDERALSGDLSETRGLPVHHIGPLSRFHKNPQEKKYDRLVVLSGQEPQRSILEDIIFQQLPDLPGRTLVVRGVLNGAKPRQSAGRVDVRAYMTAADLNRAICASDVVISRSGYSSIMDYAALGVRAVLIPTPGQTEQEYLADRLREKGYYYSETQEQLNLGRALQASLKFPGIDLGTDRGELHRHVERLCRSIA